MVKKEELLKEIKKNKVYTDLVKKALKQASVSHEGQVRDDGPSVLEGHIYPIAFSILKRYRGKDFLENLVILALLHDTMEDDENFDEETCLQIFNEEICENVKKLTKDEKTIRSYSGKNENLYELLKYLRNKEYIENVNGSNEICKIVKLEDRINNLQCTGKTGTTVQGLRYVIESDTLFISMAKKTKSFDYVPLLKKEIERLSS
jgi:(p)ppGpp synthase/HD superfamily hydrolase